MNSRLTKFFIGDEYTKLTQGIITAKEAVMAEVKKTVPKSTVYCAALYCISKKKTNPELIFHYFPSESNRHVNITFYSIRANKFKFKLTVLNVFENLRLDCS